MSMDAAPRQRDPFAVLVLEDEYFLADDIARAVSDSGMTVVGPFATVDEAIAAASGPRRIDAAILDINLGGRTSYPVIDLLGRRGTPCVLATGYDADGVATGYDQLVCWEKPVRPETLVASVLDLLKTRDIERP